MRIIGIIKQNSGPDFHRITIPLLNMRDIDVYITNAPTEEHFEKGCDAIYYNRMIGDHILEWKRKYHFKVVVDIDDWWHLDPSHILYEHHYKNKMDAAAIKHLEIADVVTTTHERLAEAVRKYNKSVIVCPNAIPKNDPCFSVERVSGTGLRRVFWQGSVTHQHDIELLRGPFKRLNKNKFLMVIAGYMKGEPAWDAMVSAYTRGLQLKGCILDGAPVTEYYRNYSIADVCVVPLRESPFNSMKSNLKILEAAHLGLPVIASKVHPYLDMPGVMYVHNQKDWNLWLNSSDRILKLMSQNLKNYCDKHFNFDQINEVRKQAFL